MKKVFTLAIIAFVLVIAGKSVYAQEWTKEQSDLWKVVEDEWTKWKNGDIAGMAATFHEKYQGWSSDSPLPIGKTEIVEWYNQMKEIQKVNYLEIQPARIAITKTAGVVDYYFSINATYTMGDKQESKEIRGKNVEFYVKEDGKWLLLGDMTVFQ